MMRRFLSTSFATAAVLGLGTTPAEAQLPEPPTPVVAELSPSRIGEGKTTPLIFVAAAPTDGTVTVRLSEDDQLGPDDQIIASGRFSGSDQLTLPVTIDDRVINAGGGRDYTLFYQSSEDLQLAKLVQPLRVVDEDVAADNQLYLGTSWLDGRYLSILVVSPEVSSVGRLQLRLDGRVLAQTKLRTTGEPRLAELRLSKAGRRALLRHPRRARLVYTGSNQQRDLYTNIRLDLLPG